MQPPLTRQISNAKAAAGLQHLQQAEFVHVRKGGVVPPLSPVYQGPYRVLDRREKFFKLEVGLVETSPWQGSGHGSFISTTRKSQGTGPVAASNSALPASTGGAPVEDEIHKPWRRKLLNYMVAYISLFPDLCASLLLMLSE
jgi:hypothetical protein